MMAVSEEVSTGSPFSEVSHAASARQSWPSMNIADGELVCGEKVMRIAEVVHTLSGSGGPNRSEKNGKKQAEGYISCSRSTSASC